MGFVVRDLRKKQFFMVDDIYLNGYARLCGAMATLVYLALCRHANKEQSCFPSKKILAEKLAISERSVYDALRVLEQYEIIKIEYPGRKPNGTFKNNIYLLRDRTQWQPLPSATPASGNKQQPPSATDDIIHRHLVPNKGTHNKGTHNKGTHIGDFPFFKDTSFSVTYQHYLQMRKSIRKPATARAEELVLKKLHKYDMQTAVAMLEQSIVNSYQDVYPLRKEKKNGRVYKPDTERESRGKQLDAIGREV